MKLLVFSIVFFVGSALATEAAFEKKPSPEIIEALTTKDFKSMRKDTLIECINYQQQIIREKENEVQKLSNDATRLSHDVDSLNSINDSIVKFVPVLEKCELELKQLEDSLVISNRLIASMSDTLKAISSHDADGEDGSVDGGELLYSQKNIPIGTFLVPHKVALDPYGKQYTTVNDVYYFAYNQDHNIAFAIFKYGSNYHTGEVFGVAKAQVSGGYIWSADPEESGELSTVSIVLSKGSLSLKFKNMLYYGGTRISFNDIVLNGTNLQFKLSE